MGILTYSRAGVKSGSAAVLDGAMYVAVGRSDTPRPGRLEQT